MMTTRLPIDLIYEVLSKLPAKTLLRFKSVCKLWNFLISNQYFVNLHLERSLASKTNLHYVVSAPQHYMQKYDHRPEPLETNCPVLYSSDFDNLDNPLELSHPYKNCTTAVWVVGSCRGLLLLSVGNGEPLLLYNPTTQTYNILPHLTQYEMGWTYTHFYFGLGYDSVAKDYKCVRIWQCLYDDNGAFWCEVMVYSMRDNCWRRVADVPYYFKVRLFELGAALVNEVFHWVGTNGNNLYEPIVAFSLRDETFSSLALPNFNLEQSDDLFVGVLDDCLCLMVNRYLHCDLWIMKEYGVVGSWTRVFTFVNHHCNNLERPISYTMNKKKLFVRKSFFQLVFLDLETMELSADVMFADSDRGLDAHVYVENLLRLDYPEVADDIHIRKEQHGKRKNRKRRRRRRKTRRDSERKQVEALQIHLQETSQRLEMVETEKAKAESDLKSLSDAFNSLELANFQLEKELKLLRSGGATSYETGEPSQKEDEVESKSLLVSLVQEQSKVERLSAQLMELGEDVDKLLEATSDDNHRG